MMLWAALSAQAQIPVTTCGTEITQPGNYILANDLLGCSGNGIVIQSEGVTLNLNSHQITGPGSGVSRGISVLAHKGTVIEGPGTIARFYFGVYLERAVGGAHIVGITAQDNTTGFYLSGSREVTLGANMAVSNDAGFLLFDSSDNQLVENIVNSNRNMGIQIVGSRNEIILNTAENNGTYGIEVVRGFGSHDNRITFNTATGNATFDLAERGYSTCRSTWTSNMFSTANLPCIH
jgi:parallel beta-helix repeat protein